MIRTLTVFLFLSSSAFAQVGGVIGGGGGGGGTSVSAPDSTLGQFQSDADRPEGSEAPFGREAGCRGRSLDSPGHDGAGAAGADRGTAYRSVPQPVLRRLVGACAAVRPPGRPHAMWKLLS